MYVNHIHTTDRTDRGTRKLQCKPGLPSGSYNAPCSLSGSCRLLFYPDMEEFSADLSGLDLIDLQLAASHPQEAVVGITPAPAARRKPGSGSGRRDA